MDFGIAIAGLSVSTAAVVITAIKTKSNGNGNGNGKVTCLLHSGIEATLKSIVEKVDEAADDIKKILGKIGGV